MAPGRQAGRPHRAAWAIAREDEGPAAAPIYPGRVSAMYAWLRRHPMLVDGVLAAALLFGGVGAGFAKGMFLGIPLGLGLVVPVVFRRKHPVAAYYTAVAAGG